MRNITVYIGYDECGTLVTVLPEYVFVSDDEGCMIVDNIKDLRELLSVCECSVVLPWMGEYRLVLGHDGKWAIQERRRDGTD